MSESQPWIGGSEISPGNLYVDGRLALSLVLGIEQTLGFPTLFGASGIFLKNP
jgi:hypothetical protein